MKAEIAIGGPYYDDLAVGDRFETAPAVTLTEGLAAMHQAIVGDRLRLALDAELSQRVAGRRIAHPALVWDVAIGQSTLVTQRVIANLYYKNLVLLRFPAIGDTLSTTTAITGLRLTSPKPDRPRRGLADLHIRTFDQEGRPILDFHRCAMLPVRAENNSVEDEAKRPPANLSSPQLAAAVSGWNLQAFKSSIPGPHFADIEAAARYRIEGGDVVSSAPELARLTLNLAMIHHDSASAAGGRRLVYGGHTIGIAAGQLARALPALVTILGWESCDHTGPVHEGDTLHSEVSVERTEPLTAGGGLVHLRSLVQATRPGGEKSAVLDWRLVGLFA